ncbi:hypothetical protein JA1_004332 [Spathaspora sp. JA1]|nr:hypothetical protein JA1_004332 [Spathaspora sp. JA1]
MFMNYIQSASRSIFGNKPIINTLLQTRTKMKSHKGIRARFIKTASGLKRKKAGRNHGNGRFANSELKPLNGYFEVEGKKDLKKLLKYF